MNYAQEAATIFCKDHEFDINSHIHAQITKAIESEAHYELDRGTLKGQRRQYSKALDIALENFDYWYENGLDYQFDTYHDFVSDHRAACVFAVLLRRHIEGLDKI